MIEGCKESTGTLYLYCRLDGFIVCEEDKDILLAAWDEDQEIQKQRETEVKETLKKVKGTSTYTDTYFEIKVDRNRILYN